jgi:hypothetical protein
LSFQLVADQDETRPVGGVAPSKPLDMLDGIAFPHMMMVVVEEGKLNL